MVKTTIAQVDQMIAENKVFMISKSYCPFCTKAKKALDSVKANYKVLEIENDDNCNEIQNEMGKRTGARSVPRVFIDQKFVGGGDDIARLASSGQLAKMV